MFLVKGNIVRLLMLEIHLKCISLSKPLILVINVEERSFVILTTIFI